MSARTVACVLLFVAAAAMAGAQPRPIETEDAATVPAGTVRVTAGVSRLARQPYPVSGLTGTLWRVPEAGVTVGLGPVAEFQVYGGWDALRIDARRTAPLSELVTAVGESTSDVADVVLATKIALRRESSGGPAVAVRVATKLPNAGNESGLGTDTTDVYGSLHLSQQLERLRVTGALGLGILGDPTDGQRQNDVTTYGVSAIVQAVRSLSVVADLSGRTSTRAHGAFPGTESRRRLTGGLRVVRGAWQLDLAAIHGLTTTEPLTGVTAGITWQRQASPRP